MKPVGEPDKPQLSPQTSSQAVLGARPPARPRLVSISDNPDDEGFFQEARTMDISVRSTDFGAAPPTQPGRVDRAVLLRMDGVSAGQVMAISQSPFSIGRHPTNQLRVDDDSISRFHARFVREADGFYVEDLESRNGTFVQGKRVLRSKLSDDDWVQFGSRVSFRFTMTDARQEGLMRRLFESSTRDSLTGAYNRMHFEDRLRAEVAFGARHGTDCALVLVDLDHFKRVNDGFGHPAGDEVLRHLAAIASRTLRAEDIFARFGGEEFAVLLRGSSTKGAARLAERLREALASTPASHEGTAIPVTLSAGCAALSCCQIPTPNELVATADRRLYRAKAEGRNRVVASDEK